jgi:hypothetical protein
MYPNPENCGKKTAMLLVCAVLFSIRFTQAQCIASGPNSPGTSSNVPFSGSDYSFTDPLNVLSDDNNEANAASIASLSAKQTDYLQVKNFGFNIPTAASICGIEVHVKKSAANLLPILAYVKDYSVLLMNGNTFSVEDKADPGEWSSTETSVTYGGVNELWLSGWSPADINSNDFGFSIAGELKTYLGLLPTLSIDHISITVHYLDPTVLPAQSIQFNVANASNRTAMLSWKQSGFDESASFIVERSIEGLKWESLHGSAQKNSSAMYTFKDAQPLTGKSFYRLKMITARGEIRYSTTQPFELNDHIILTCYPNPFTSFVQVKGLMTGERVTVTNIFGQRVYMSAPAVSNVQTIDINDLQPGIYVISAGNRKMKVEKK